MLAHVFCSLCLPSPRMQLSPRKERYISHKRRERCSLCAFATTNISGHHHTILHLTSNNSSLRSTSTTQLQLAAVPPLVPAVVHVAENDSVPPPFQCFKIAGSWLRHHLCAFCLLSSVRLPDSCMTTALPSSFTTMLSSFSGVPSPRFGVRTSGHDLHRFIHMAIHACTRTRFRGSVSKITSLRPIIDAPPCFAAIDPEVFVTRTRQYPRSCWYHCVQVTP